MVVVVAMVVVVELVHDGCHEVVAVGTKVVVVMVGREMGVTTVAVISVGLVMHSN